MYPISSTYTRSLAIFIPHIEMMEEVACSDERTLGTFGAIKREEDCLSSSKKRFERHTSEPKTKSSRAVLW